MRDAQPPGFVASRREHHSLRYIRGSYRKEFSAVVSDSCKDTRTVVQVVARPPDVRKKNACPGDGSADSRTEECQTSDPDYYSARLKYRVAPTPPKLIPVTPGSELRPQWISNTH